MCNELLAIDDADLAVLRSALAAIARDLDRQEPATAVGR
jgi:hypothetical protein